MNGYDGKPTPPPPYVPDDFVDRRDVNKISVDRLGLGDCKTAVCKKVACLAVAHVARTKSVDSFKGWVYLRVDAVRDFGKVTVHASPIPADDSAGTDGNLWHAHLSVSDPKNDSDPDVIALIIYNMFYKKNAGFKPSPAAQGM
ncbi:MAG: hypothetical protein R3E77_11245 [Steroidobacteraceae bacterium]